MLTNAAIAERLEAFSVLLELAGAQSYTARAYRRAADMIRVTPVPIVDLVRQGRARDLRGIGPGIERRLRELVETGEIHELSELERQVRPELIGLGRFLGVSPKRAIEIGETLGVTNLDELREAARAGRLTEVPGIGPKTAAKLTEALEGAGPTTRRGMQLGRALALEAGIAEALGGEPAGDPRRMRDASELFAVVCASERPDEVLDRFESLGSVVSIIERVERRAVGVTVDGVPVQVVAAEPERFGTELVRATGSRAYVEALEPLPGRAGRERCLPRPRDPVVPARAARAALPRRAAAARRAQRRARRAPLPHDVVGRQGERARDGHRRPRPGLRVPGDLRPHEGGRGRARPGLERRAAPGGRDRRGERGARALPRPARDRVRHPPRRLARPDRPRAGRARLGDGERPRGAACAPAGDHRPHRRRAAPSRRCVRSATRPVGSSTTVRRTPSTWRS